MRRYISPKGALQQVAFRESWDLVNLHSFTHFDFEDDDSYRDFALTSANRKTLVIDAMVKSRHGNTYVPGTLWTVRYRVIGEYKSFDTDIFSFNSLPLDELRIIVERERKS